MRAVVQRVLSASVEVSALLNSLCTVVICSESWWTRALNAPSGRSQVEGRVVSAIGPGLLVLVGVHEADTDSDADYMYRLLFINPPHFLQLVAYYWLLPAIVSIIVCLDFTHSNLWKLTRICSGNLLIQRSVSCVGSLISYLSWWSD